MILETKRLIIRKFRSTDRASLIDMFTNDEVMKYIGPHRAMTENEIQAWLSNILSIQDVELTRYAVALKVNDELIGVAGVREEDGTKDFGYYFRRDYWGKVLQARHVQRSSITSKTIFTSRITRFLLQMKISTVFD